jgi:Bacterial trigger factor protein (TF)
LENKKNRFFCLFLILPVHVVQVLSTIDIRRSIILWILKVQYLIQLVLTHQKKTFSFTMKFQSAFVALLLCIYDTQSFNLGTGVRYVQKQQQQLYQPWGKIITTSTTHLSMSTAEPPSSPVSVKRLENSAVQIEIPVSGKATKAAYDKVCMELSKQLTLPGFRKGSKIPPQVLEQTLVARGGGRNAIKVQAINELVTQLVQPTLKDQSLEPIGTPTLQVSAETLAETFIAGNELTLHVTCDVWPEIQWLSPLDGQSKPYTGLQGSYKRKPFNQDKLNASVRDLCERYATIEPIVDNDDYVLSTGDACTVNMVGYMATADGQKGELLPNAASGDNVEVIIGPGRYMDGLVEGLVGHKKGETVTVSVTFPEVRFFF